MDAVNLCRRQGRHHRSADHPELPHDGHTVHRSGWIYRGKSNPRNLADPRHDSTVEPHTGRWQRPKHTVPEECKLAALNKIKLCIQSHDPITRDGDGTSLLQPSVKLGIGLGTLFVCFLCFAQSARLYAHTVSSYGLTDLFSCLSSCINDTLQICSSFVYLLLSFKLLHACTCTWTSAKACWCWPTAETGSHTGKRSGVYIPDPRV